MIFVYNFLQFALLILASPLILLIVLTQKKYRTRIGERLGLGLADKLRGLDRSRKTIWIHSLSVGEVNSALPLVRALREKPDVNLVFSATTAAGMNIALNRIRPHADLVMAAPLDLLFVVNRFVRLVRPDMFILVETDFWPNWLHALQRNKVCLALVNGRISESSFRKYRRFHFFFQPMFDRFNLLSMQTQHDAAKMAQLGAAEKKIQTLGNLKYDTGSFTNAAQAKSGFKDERIPDHALIWVCGSTHPGEEEMILTSFGEILRKRNDCFLLLAPRDPNRGGEIQKLAKAQGLRSMRRTRPDETEAPIMILDTLGELAECYKLARAAFIGGSLINFGGHNPLEASTHGVPVLFGPHMDDFPEIAGDLIACGAAVRVNSAEELEPSALRILDDPQTHQRMSAAARALIERNTGVISNHARELRSLLAQIPART